MSEALPFVGLPADTHEKSGFIFHSLGDKYVAALREVSKVGALMVPAFASDQEIDAALGHCDGLLLTGAISNVHPPLYGEAATERHEPFDHARDQSTMRLIRGAVAKGMPLFCICRGFQELNVALGGTLETEVQEASGRLDHRGIGDIPEERYSPKHKIAIEKNGVLARILGKSETTVNSVHRQGIKKLASGLMVEATAPDGIIECVSVRGAAAFALGTQWHPEYRAAENPDSVKLFEAFGDAVRAHARARNQAQQGLRRSA